MKAVHRRAMEVAPHRAMKAVHPLGMEEALHLAMGRSQVGILQPPLLIMEVPRLVMKVAMGLVSIHHRKGMLGVVRHHIGALLRHRMRVALRLMLATMVELRLQTMLLHITAEERRLLLSMELPRNNRRQATAVVMAL